MAVTTRDDDRRAAQVGRRRVPEGVRQRAGVTSDGGSILDLFADDAQVYFPKWGIATGREQIGQMFGDVGGTLKAIEHHYDELQLGLHRRRHARRRGHQPRRAPDGPWRAGDARARAPAAGATCSRSATGRSSAASSTSTPTTPARTPSATPGSPVVTEGPGSPGGAPVNQAPLPPARVAVLGPGGVGGLLAALLARRGDQGHLPGPAGHRRPPGRQRPGAAQPRPRRHPGGGRGRHAGSTTRSTSCFVTVKAAQLGGGGRGRPRRGPGRRPGGAVPQRHRPRRLAARALPARPGGGRHHPGRVDPGRSGRDRARLPVRRRRAGRRQGPPGPGGGAGGAAGRDRPGRDRPRRRGHHPLVQAGRAGPDRARHHLDRPPPSGRRGPGTGTSWPR